MLFLSNLMIFDLFFLFIFVFFIFSTFPLFVFTCVSFHFLFSSFVFTCVSFHFLFLFLKHSLHSGRSLVTRKTVATSTIFAFVKLTLRL